MVEEVKEETQLQDGIDIALLRDQKFTVEEYKEALAAGKSAVLAQRQSVGEQVMKIKLGNLLPG